MVFTPYLSPDQVAAAQSDLDHSFRRIVESGFLSPTKSAPSSRTRTCTQAIGHSTKTVVVEQARSPRLKPEEVRQKFAASEAQRKEKAAADATRKRQEDKALQTLRSTSLPLEQRIVAAKSLGFSVIYRGPQDRPHKVVFRKGAERIAALFPRGKNKNQGR